MPELPEVETVTRAIQHYCQHHTFTSCLFLTPKLRSEVKATEIKALLEGFELQTIERRSKYIILKTTQGGVIIHLGMSGRIYILDQASPQQKHTHFIFTLTAKGATGNKKHYLHYVDPRRFGLIEPFQNEFSMHPLLSHLGPEPLATKNLAEHLFKRSRSLSRPIKSFIMDAEIVVGVGNIYASESLFLAGIHPESPARNLSIEQYKALEKSIKKVLNQAIKAGGTTIRDFATIDGSTGYFQNKLAVYGRAGESCLKCQKPIMTIRQSGRSTFFCANCQIHT